MSAVWPQGLVTAVVSPLKDDELDIAAFHRVVDHQVANGAAGVIVAGGTGEMGVLTVAERRILAQESVSAAAGRIPVIVQTGALSTRDAVELSSHAQQVGADGIMVASPFGEGINWRERVRFYERVTAAVDLPVMIYNTPPSGNLSLERLALLAELAHVNAVKDSSGSAEQMGDVLAWSADRDFAVYVGMDHLLEYAIPAGATGAVFGAASFLPAEISHVLTLLRQGTSDPTTATLWREMRSMLRWLEVSSNYVALCKVGLRLDGIDVGPVREPFLMPEQEEIDELVRRTAALRAVFGPEHSSA